MIFARRFHGTVSQLVGLLRDCSEQAVQVTLDFQRKRVPNVWVVDVWSGPQQRITYDTLGIGEDGGGYVRQLELPMAVTITDENWQVDTMTGELVAARQEGDEDARPN